MDVIAYVAAALVGLWAHAAPTRSQPQSARCAVCGGFRSMSSPKRVQIVTFGGQAPIIHFRLW
jgi:hypothetical protein